MGAVRRLLYGKPLSSPSPAMYAPTRSIEAAESLHIHERNIRLEYSGDEFEALARCLERASGEDCSLSSQTRYLRLDSISPEPGISPDRFEVEESEYPTLKDTTIHVHYRNLRLEFNHEEWVEFAGGILEAWEAWQQHTP